jgi:transaldolase/glucose-6-phosphate isomerase
VDAGAKAPESLEDSVSSLVGSLRPGDYFAITAYVPSTPENEAALQKVRLAVRDGKRVATTVGFGPRFLHSTGQLHKGGPATGVFLQLTCEAPQDVPIPGRPETFGRVVAAQAAGDLAALESRGRRAKTVSLGPDVAAGLARLGRAVQSAVSG